jgi:hypothetical protein
MLAAAAGLLDSVVAAVRHEPAVRAPLLVVADLLLGAEVLRLAQLRPQPLLPLLPW